METAQSDRSANIIKALARAKAAGAQLGNPDPEPSLKKARAIQAAQAKVFASDHLPIIGFFQSQCFSLRAISRELNRRNALTFRGRNWQASQLKNILERPAPTGPAHPFYIEGPAIISFSGGCTSAFMLKQMLDFAGGKLPDRVQVVFANTGKERPETLDFVQQCADQWCIPITWLEYDPREPHNTRIVNHNSASRSGEPYEILISKKQFLPNPVIRHCTSELKVKRIEAFARHFCGFKSWWSFIGIRFDEPRRVKKILSRRPDCIFDCSRAGPHTLLPLHRTRFIEADILTWWQNQPFNLDLKPHEGNCDLCFLKGIKKIRAIMADRPDLAQWWIYQESRKIGRTAQVRYFRKDRPGYAAILEQVASDTQLPDDTDFEYNDCACTD